MRVAVGGLLQRWGRAAASDLASGHRVPVVPQRFGARGRRRPAQALVSKRLKF
jgi:hypothetical protein